MRKKIYFSLPRDSAKSFLRTKNEKIVKAIKKRSTDYFLITVHCEVVVISINWLGIFKYCVYRILVKAYIYICACSTVRYIAVQHLYPFLFCFSFSFFITFHLFSFEMYIPLYLIKLPLSFTNMYVSTGNSSKSFVFGYTVERRCVT